MLEKNTNPALLPQETPGMSLNLTENLLLEV